MPASRSPARVRSSTATPAEPNRSKNADCGLTAATVPGERLDAGHRERLQALHGVGQPPRGQQAGVRVDADAQRAVLGHGAVQPRAERSRSPALIGAGPAGRARRPRRRSRRAKPLSRSSAASSRLTRTGALGSLNVAVPTWTALAPAATISQGVAHRCALPRRR